MSESVVSLGEELPPLRVLVVDDSHLNYEVIINYLKDYEVYSLFLIANIEEQDFPSHYYIAEQDDMIIGVAAYFPTFQSFSLFTKEAEVSKGLTHFVSKNHNIKTLLAIANCGKDSILPLMVQPA